MKITKGFRHDKETFLLAFTHMLERASYYGLRALVVLYITGDVFKMSTDHALSIFGWFAFAIIFSHIFGAFIGDLLLGNKNAIILGLTIQTIAALTICIPTNFGLYTGLSLLVIGSGLHTPNLTSNFGKLYLNKTKLLDSGFTILFLAVNLGAFLGTLTIGHLGDTHGYHIGFISAAAVSLLALLSFLFTKRKATIIHDSRYNVFNQKIIETFFVFVLIGIFWAIYNIAGIRSYQL